MRQLSSHSASDPKEGTGANSDSELVDDKDGGQRQEVEFARVANGAAKDHDCLQDHDHADDTGGAQSEEFDDIPRLVGVERRSLELLNLELKDVRLYLSLGVSPVALGIDLVLEDLPHPALDFLEEDVEKKKAAQEEPRAER